MVDPMKALIGMPAGMGTLLLGEPKPWVREPYEHYERRMIGRKFAEWLESAHPDDDGSTRYSRDDLEAAFRAGYDTPECW